MQAEQGSQLTGVIIGAAIAAFVALVGHVVALLSTWHTSKRETDQWNRQQIADRDKRRHEEKKAERERRREVYLKSLNCLTSLMHLQADGTELEPEELRKRVDESLTWLNQLSLPYRVDENIQVSRFHSKLASFIEEPMSYVSGMKTAVTDLAMTDKTLFPNAPKEPEKLPETTGQLPNEETITFQMSVDNDFRKQQIVKAVLVPQNHIFTLQLPELTEEQRELLANIYFSSNHRIPQTITLPMPLPTPNPTQPYQPGGSWKAKCNPHTTKPNDILKLWESDYKEAFNRINGPTQK